MRSDVKSVRYPASGFYRKKTIFALVDFKDIVKALALTLAFAFILILVTITADGFNPSRLISALLNPDQQTLSDVYGNAFGGMMVGVMALLLTVVAFVVEMAANRYTAKIVDLFIAHPVNIFFMSFASMTTFSSIFLLYLGDSSKIMPKFSILLTFILVSILVITMFPYFVFIFRFIQPSNVIYNIEKETFLNILKSYRIKNLSGHRIKKLHGGCINGINQLSDITMNCIQNKDGILAIECIRSLRYLMTNYIGLQYKKPLPDLWLTRSDPVKMDVSFITVSEQNTSQIDFRFWVEDKILKELEKLFRSSINSDRTICNYIANSLFIIGCGALETKNYPVIKKAIIYFNTFLRATINENDIRTGFNILNQYRKLAENLIVSHEDAISIEIVNHFKYYGLLAKDRGMDFILETAAHDICDICKKAFSVSLAKESEILDIFLTVDMPIEGEKAVSLRGIRKAQIQLAAHYLSRQTENASMLARKIYTDMLDELHSPDGFERIFGMIKELKYTKKDFWEINDREYDFNYCSTDEKMRLQEFLNYFLCRLIILHASECGDKQKNKKSSGYFNDIQRVLEDLPEKPPIEELEFEKELGPENLDNKSGFINHILKLEAYLGSRDNLIKEISIQGDLVRLNNPADLNIISKGLSSFFDEFRGVNHCPEPIAVRQV